jgi:hypothetical protein
MRYIKIFENFNSDKHIIDVIKNFLLEIDTDGSVYGN